MDSFDLNWAPKQEDNEDSDSPRKETRLQWTAENTRKLIDIWERDCQELWDVKNPSNKDRNARQAKFEYLAELFGTTSEEISRKIHNLRTQFNNELRKIRRKQSGGSEGSQASVYGSGWEYFDALSFLQRTPIIDPLDCGMEGVNLELAEFQAHEEEEFGPGLLSAKVEPEAEVVAPKRGIRVAASAPPPLPPSAHPLMWPENPAPTLRPGLNTDECQVFGDFVASELRSLRSDESRKKLKRIIQKAILKIGEEEDVNIISG